MKHAAFDRFDAIEQRRLGMAECGWQGLSEGWMLRHLGDVHWRLIAAAMGQEAAVFADATGAPVYAAFCAVEERILRPDLARPGAMLTLASQLRRLSATRLISFHQLEIGGATLAEVTLITAFVRHGASGNAHILRAEPCGRLDLPQMEQDADGGFFAEAARLYRGWPTPREGADATVTPCPTTEFNAAGLLYCANYPALVDRAEWALFPDLAAGRPLTLRKVVYLANVDPGEPVTATLSRDARGHGATLVSRGRVIARVITERLN